MLLFVIEDNKEPFAEGSDDLCANPTFSWTETSASMIDVLRYCAIAMQRAKARYAQWKRTVGFNGGFFLTRWLDALCRDTSGVWMNSQYRRLSFHDLKLIKT